MVLPFLASGGGLVKWENGVRHCPIPFSDILVYMKSRLKILLRLVHRCNDLLFDLRRGVRTFRSAAPPGGRDASHFRAYDCSRTRPLRRALKRLDLGAEGFHFVDLGCGKGKAMLMALEAGYRACFGVDLSPALCRQAVRNLSRRLAPEDWWRFHVDEADVRRWQLPPGDKLLYLYNPFDEVILREVIRGIEQAAAHRPKDRMMVLYMNPLRAALLDRHPGFERLFGHHDFDHNRSVAAWRWVPSGFTRPGAPSG